MNPKQRSNVVARYLEGYGEPVVQTLTQWLAAWPEPLRWRQVLVVPVCGERSDFVDRVPDPTDTLAIIVVNQSLDSSVSKARCNQAFVRSLTTRGTVLQRCADLLLLRLQDCGLHVLLLDRYSCNRTLPVDGGVGHARKLGADLAVALCDRGRLTGRWVFNSDADTHLPADYFTRPHGMNDDAAVIFPFQHVHGPDSDLRITTATVLYEVSLHHYVEGLRQAGSPYAFHSVGSTFAFDAEAYAKVRGFPKRAAAEDFYMLNKLAKVGPVRPLTGEPIRIEARISDRVPFGTGAAVGKMVKAPKLMQSYDFYHPEVFALLAYWLNSFSALWEHRAQGVEAALQPVIQRAPSTMRSEAMAALLAHIGAHKGVAHGFKQARDQDQFHKQLHDWFDGFRTLKMVHWLRDHVAASVPLSQLLALAPCEALKQQCGEQIKWLAGVDATSEATVARPWQCAES